MGFIYMTIEKYTDNDIDVFENDIQVYISQFCNEYNISDINSMSQSVYKAMLKYVNKYVFKGTNKLKSKNKYVIVDNNNLRSNYNSYDIELVNDLCDYYIYLCQLYDKEITIAGFCALSGIEFETIHAWRDERGKNASARSSEIHKKLTAERERSLSDKLLSGKVNPVGVLGILNHYYNWAGVGKMEERKTDAATLADVQKRAALLSDNSRKDQDENGEKPVIELSDNLTQLETP